MTNNERRGKAMMLLLEGGDPLAMWRAIGLIADEARAEIYRAGPTSLQNGAMSKPQGEATCK